MLNISILSVSHKQESWVNQAYNEYAQRFSPKEIGIKLIEIKPEPRENISISTAKTIEVKKITQNISKGSRVVLLDERGKDLNSVQWSDKLKTWQENNQDITIIIGGADGVTQEFRDSADELLRLSSLTLPHGLVRVILIEQLYRASSILKNHPYHRS